MKKKIIFAILLVVILVPVFSQVFYKNEGLSKSIGTEGNGKLINAYKLPWKGNNFKNFSLFDYFVLGRCYVHSSLHKIVIDSYSELASIYPDYKFRYMECSKKKGGRPFPHHTHQNGLSIDFMTPLKKQNKTTASYDWIGMWRYIMEFDKNGKFTLNKKVEIDFEKIAVHILMLEKTARKNGYHIKKVILETNLKDELFATKYGKKLKQSGVYFVKHLSPKINALHDDHYHIDFAKL